MALNDMGFVDFEEPFKSLTHQGIILGPDGKRMSKSKGNVVSPDGYIEEHGSDVLRLFLAFGYAYTEGGPWDENGISATVRFVERVERIIQKVNTYELTDYSLMKKDEKELNYIRNYAIKGITEDADKMQYNTCVSRMMELTNALYKYDNDVNTKNIQLMKDCIKDLMIIMSPFAPHFCEEMWNQSGYEFSIFNQDWPEVNESALILETVEIAVQINGKVRSKLDISSSLSKQEIEEFALNDSEVKSLIEGKSVIKVIVVPNRLVNIVVK
jgi:leucyl-tRNA synthetase